MAQGPSIQTGDFTSDGTDKSILLSADVDRVLVENRTEMVATNSGHGFRYTWYIGLKQTMVKEYHPAADHTSAVDIESDAILPVDRFSPRDSLTFTSITAGTNSTQPVFSTADTTDLKTGTIVRIYDTDQTNLNGIDFTISNVVTNTSFKLENTLATAPGITAGSSGKYMIVAEDTNAFDYFYNPKINISNITKASNAVITTITDHNVDVNLYIKFEVPSVYGMTEIDGLTGKIVSVTSNTITVDIDSSLFTAFKFPLFTDYPFDLATAETVDYDGQTVNYDMTEYSGNETYAFVAMTLRAGSSKPAGSVGDEIKWTVYNAQGEDDDFYDAP